DAWCAKYPDATEFPNWAELLRRDVPIFDLDYDAILAAMYALTVSAEGDCYLCVPPDPGIENAALGASESALSGTASAQALHTFMLDSDASRCFFRDSTTVTPLPAPVPVSLADPSGGPVLARATTVLPCPAVPSGELSGLHIPSFSTNLVSNAVLQDHWVDTWTPGGQRVAILICSKTGRHLATFTRELGSSLYTLTIVSRYTPLSPQLYASAQVATQCECRRLSHDTLLWHHRLGHPSLPHLRGMHSRLLVSGLPRSLPALPPSPVPPCIPCVEGRQRAAPHSSFPLTEAPLQTLHLDVWGPAHVLGQGRERYFLLVVDDYTRYTTVFPLCSKGQVLDVLIPWIRTVHLQLRKRFHSDFPVLRLHSDRGVSLPETSPTLLWTGEVGDASRFRVWGARAFVRDTTADKLSARAIPCIFLGFPPDAPGWQFYDPASRRVFASQDVTFDESVLFYRGPARGAVSGGVEPGGAEPGGEESGGAAPGSAESGGATPEREEPGGAKPGGTEPEREETGGTMPGGAAPEGTKTAGARSPWSGRLRPRVPLTSQQRHDWYGRHKGRASGAWGFAAGGSSADVSGAGSGAGSLSPGGARTGGTGADGTGGAVSRGAGAEGTKAGDPGTRGASSRGAAAGDTEAGDPRTIGASSGGAAAGGAGARDSGAAGAAGAAGAGGTEQPPDTVLRQVLSLPSSTGLPLQPGSPLPAPSPYTEQTGCLAERREPASRPLSPVHSGRTSRRVPCLRSPALPGAHLVVRRPSSAPQRVPLPSPPASSLRDGYTFSFGSGSISWRSTHSSSVLGSSCEAEIYATSMAAQELRWLTYLMTDLGERPCSPLVLYVDNKAAIALYEEHRLEHRTKHIALRYYLAREKQQRGQLRLALVATRANSADIFTKALPSGDH
ncbi:unnamed protein product, partial [Closterium sp. NIES-53]